MISLNANILGLYLVYILKKIVGSNIFFQRSLLNNFPL